jgi:4-hydroxyphenylpyruvate dioxygenase-like putative hemolysin
MKENKTRCRSIYEAKKIIKDKGFRYIGNDNYKEYKIMYYKKGRVSLILTSEPHSFIEKDSMQIGTSWFIQEFIGKNIC